MNCNGLLHHAICACFFYFLFLVLPSLVSIFSNFLICTCVSMNEHMIVARVRNVSAPRIIFLNVVAKPWHQALAKLGMAQHCLAFLGKQVYINRCIFLSV